MSTSGKATASSALWTPGQLGDNVVAPFHPALANGSMSTGFANGAVGCRVKVPKSGQLRDLTVFQVASSGNVSVGVFDTGDALAGSRTRLWSTGSIACPAANGWRTVGDPNIAVVAGQELDFLFAADNLTATIARAAAVVGDLNLPASFWPAAGGASPKLGVRPTAGMMPLPATITEANMVSIGTVPMIIARIS